MVSVSAQSASFTEGGTLVSSSPEWKLGQKSLKRADDGTVAMNIDGRFTGTVTVLWNGTGVGDTGGDWTRSGVGSETTASAKSGTNGLNTTITDEDDESVFDNGSMADINGTYDTLQFWIMAKRFPVDSDPVVFWRDSSDATVGLVVHLNDYVEDFDDTWHRVNISIEEFALTGNVQKLVFRYEGVDGQRYFIDDIELLESGGGPYTFRAKAPVGVIWHVKDILLSFVEENGTWNAGDFTGINGGLNNGLLLRHRRRSTGEVFFKINSKSNINLFSRYRVVNDVEYSSAIHQLTIGINPSPAALKVTDDDVIEFQVRDNLSSINAMRSLIEYAEEQVA